MHSDKTDWRLLGGQAAVGRQGLAPVFTSKVSEGLTGVDTCQNYQAAQFNCVRFILCYPNKAILKSEY